MTSADTAALSTPMKAHSAMDALREIAALSSMPLTFQPALNKVASNHHQPAMAMLRIGIRASSRVPVSSAPIQRAPRALARLNSQITARVKPSRGYSSCSNGQR
ncbi:hypothetical protein D3C81_1658270 [compost metagenome]